MKLSTAAFLSSLASCAIFCIYLAAANVASEGEDFVTMELAQETSPVQTTLEYLRPPDQTFLTFPEWFLVHSPKEYADLLASGRPSDFPFFRHIGQFWQAYAKVYGLTRRHFAFNSEYHTMIVVIGVSTTVEYFLKGTYETLVGRQTELISYHTSEDQAAQLEAKDYFDFILNEPWYKFDFLKHVRNLWQSNDIFRADVIRKLDRKYALTTEFLVKAMYGYLIGKATGASFEAPKPTTAVVTEHGLDLSRPGVERIQTFDNGNVLWTLPRYAQFTDRSIEFAKNGANFKEIAGNQGSILVTVLVPTQWRPRTALFDVLFAQPIITKPELKRLALVVPIHQLGETLRMMTAEPFQVEHVYDF